MSYRQVLLSTVFVILMLRFYLFAALHPLSPADHSTGWSDGAIVMGKLPVPRRPPTPPTPVLLSLTEAQLLCRTDKYYFLPCL